MKTLKLKALYEPLIIEIGETVVNASIDVTADNLFTLSEVCGKAKKDMDGITAMLGKAQKDSDFDLLRKLNRKAAKTMEPAIVAAIGQESYDEIIEACGAGRKVSKEACNVVMIRVLTAIAETVNEQKVIENEKAAHYLTEVEDAQPEPYPEL